MIRYIMENALNTNKSWLCAAILIIATSTSSIADAANNKPINGKVYISANYGVGIANKFDYDEELQVVRPKNSQIFGLSLGYKFNDNIRAELAFNRFHKFKYEDNIKYNDNENPHIFHYRNQKISSNALFANFYFDINKFKKFAPYVNVGLGVSRNKAGDFSNTVVQEHNVKDEVWLEKKSQNKFAWNVGAGVGYNIWIQYK